MKTNGNGKHQNQTIDRLPPHDLEAEQGVLGCILLDPGAAVPECDGLPTDAMYDLRHRSIYGHLLAMHDERIPIDILTVQSRLRDNGCLEEVGGVEYLSQAVDKTPSAAHIAAYVKIVACKARLRRIIQAAGSIAGKAYDAVDDDIEEVIDEAERAILRIGDETAGKSIPSMADLVQRALTTIEDFHLHQGVVRGLSTGFPDLDALTCGLQNGEMYVIAGRPSSGKTAIAMQIAELTAVDNHVPTGVFSLEMTAESLALRMLCSRARVNLRNVREGFLAERDFPRITGAAGRINSAPIYIDGTAALSVFQLRTKARRMASQFGIRLFVVDYLQLLHSSSRKADNRQQEVADISRGIKALAKELNVPIIVLCQLNREMERDKRRPRLSDLRESGAIEQDADFVGLLYRPSAKDEDGDEIDNPEASAVNLLIAKQRNGPAGMDVNLTFLRGYTRFESAAKVQA